MQMKLLKGAKPIDYALTALLVALAVFVGFANVTAGTVNDLGHQLDSQSPSIIPVFALAALPILVRRNAILAAIGVSFVVMTLSVLLFGWITRCGFALPLSLAMAYAVARFAGSRQNHVVGLVGILALQVVTLMKDASTGGLGALVASIPAALLFYGIGLFVQSRSAKRSPAPTLDHEPVTA